MGRRRSSRSRQVAVFRVKLEDLEPIDGRRPYVVIAVESGRSLDHLASAILVSFGFEIDHCYGFYDNTRHYSRSSERYELFADIGESKGPGVQNVAIEKVFTPGKQMLFLFDYGDQWHFIVRLVRYEDAAKGQEYPVVLRSHAIPIDDYYEDEPTDDDDYEDDYEDYGSVFSDEDGDEEDWRDDLFGVSGAGDQNSPYSSSLLDLALEPLYEPPTSEQWRDLFDAAVAFRDSRCYEWMDDTQLFGIKDPVSGSVWYCLILGNSGQVRGFVAYEGSAGLAALLQTMEPDAKPESVSGPNSPRSLLMFLSDRKMLDDRDLEIIKSLGLRFRGSQQWPHFRSILTGYRPWYLTSVEACTMSTLLGQALEVAKKVRRDPDLPLVKEDWKILTRVPKEDEPGGFADAYVRPETESTVPAFFDVPLDDLRVRRLRRNLVRSKSIWEISVKWVQDPIREDTDSRPFYPIMLIWIDRTTGLVLSARLTSLGRLAAELVNSTLSCMEQHAIIPKEIEVDSQDAMLILEKLAERAGFELRQVDNLRKSDIVRDELYEFLKHRKHL